MAGEEDHLRRPFGGGGTISNAEVSSPATPSSLATPKFLRPWVNNNFGGAKEMGGCREGRNFGV